VVCNYSCGIQNAPKILLTAHLDQIGMIVTNVLKDGFLKVAQVGGVDRRLLPSQRVIVQTGENNINGVVCSTPPHLQEGKETVIKMKDVLIDTGLSGEDANILSVGDTVCFAPCFEVLNNKILAATALDDRIGCVAIMLAAEKIKTDKIPCDVCVLL
ncbi:MAG: M42 family peptidase, partial [Oscillospiraceae bacterium]